MKSHTCANGHPISQQTAHNKVEVSGWRLLTVHTIGVKYFQHRLKKGRGLWPVISLMLALKRSAPVAKTKTQWGLVVVQFTSWFGNGGQLCLENIFSSWYSPPERKIQAKKRREKQIITEITAAQDKQPSCCLQPVHAHTLTSRWMTFDLSDMKCHHVIFSFWAVVWNFVVILWYTGEAEDTHQTVWLPTLLKSTLVLFSAGLRKWAKCYQYIQLFFSVWTAQTVTYSAT